MTTIDRKVHPIAALFPPLSDEELQELATDIKERGWALPWPVLGS